MGDLQTGLIVGGSYELMMIGAMPVGGAQPPNAVIGGIMATVFAVQSGLDVAAALYVSCNTICITWSICSYSFIYSNVSINGIM
ncbi:MAG: PTS sugar transporter subunit IIC [Romboutsia timonensis]